MTVILLLAGCITDDLACFQTLLWLFVEMLNSQEYLNTYSLKNKYERCGGR